MIPHLRNLDCFIRNNVIFPSSVVESFLKHVQHKNVAQYWGLQTGNKIMRFNSTASLFLHLYHINNKLSHFVYDIYKNDSV